MLSKISEFQTSLKSVIEGDVPPEECFNMLKESELLTKNIQIICSILSKSINPNNFPPGLEALIKMIVKHVEEIGKKNDFYKFFMPSNQRQLFLLGLKGILDIDKILEALNKTSANILKVAINPPNDRQKLVDIILDSKRVIPGITHCLSVDVDKLKYILINGYNENVLKTIIENDDCVALTTYVNDMSLDIEKEISVDLDIKEKMKPIDYAVYCGSVMCFKYLLLNSSSEQPVKEKKYAIIGGNLEIIRELMNRKYTFNDPESLAAAVEAGKNDIVDWIIDTNQSVFEDLNDCSTIITKAMECNRVDTFKMLASRIQPLSLFLRDCKADPIFYTSVIEDLDESARSELFTRLSNLKISWFARKWFPVKLIDPKDSFKLVMNSIKAETKDNIKTLIKLCTEMSEEEEKEIYNKCKGKFMAEIVNNKRFWKYANLTHKKFLANVKAEDSRFLSFFDIPGFADQVDEDGNNYLQYLFLNLYPNSNIKEKALMIPSFVDQITKKTDLNHKNNKGQAAADILVDRKYNNVTLLMQCAYRIAVKKLQYTEFPFQDFPKCSIHITEKEKYLFQPIYKCNTCNLKGNKGVCEACVSKCHKGHDVEFDKYYLFFCDCIPEHHHKKELFKENYDVKISNINESDLSSSDESDSSRDPDYQ